MGKGALFLVILAVWTLLTGGLGPADAQGRSVRFDGRVQWIAGQAMAVQLHAGGSVGVDLVHVPQDQYSVLSLNERVTVIGVVTDGNRRITGTSILRGDSRQAP